MYLRNLPNIKYNKKLIHRLFSLFTITQLLDISQLLVHICGCMTSHRWHSNLVVGLSITYYGHSIAHWQG